IPVHSSFTTSGIRKQLSTAPTLRNSVRTLCPSFHTHWECLSCTMSMARKTILEGPYYSDGDQHPNPGLGHLWFSVFDVPFILERLKAHNVEVFKDFGSMIGEDIPLIT
ncbi:lactoylglutathione lyase, partial [Colletotrichum asianum]